MLGVAGAYLLRALAESGAVPRIAVVSAGIAYAFLWLVWAGLARKGPRFKSSIYACTSALILAPMLWELTLDFHLLPASITAAILCAYAAAALALVWKREIVPVLRVSWIAAAGLSLALAIASHALLPFVAALLGLAMLSDLVPGRDRMPEIRWLVALATDAAIWILIYVYFNPQSAHPDYPQLSRVALVAPGVVVFALFGASTILQTVARRVRITAFAVVQTTIAFFLAAVSIADFAPASSGTILGIASLVLAVACAAAVFLVFAGAEQARSRAVFSAWCAALLLCGFWLCLPAGWAAASLGSFAVIATVVGGRKGWISLQWYGAVFMISAAAGSGLLKFAGNALAGSPAGAPALAEWFAAACAVACYATTKPRAEEPRTIQALHLGLATLATGAVTAFAAQGLVGLIALRVIPEAHHLAFIRTLTLCAAALALAFLGAQWRRSELTRLGYVMLALVAVKLVAEDLRHGHLEYIAGSIFLFAVTLIAAPRVARVSQKALQ
jgi:hypothetical protein